MSAAKLSIVIGYEHICCNPVRNHDDAWSREAAGSCYVPAHLGGDRNHKFRSAPAVSQCVMSLIQSMDRHDNWDGPRENRRKPITAGVVGVQDIVLIATDDVTECADCAMNVVAKPRIDMKPRTLLVELVRPCTTGRKYAHRVPLVNQLLGKGEEVRFRPTSSPETMNDH